MSHAVQESYIRSRLKLQEDIRHPGGMSHTRIGYDYHRAYILGPVNPAGEDRMVLRQIGSYDEYALGVGNIRYGICHSRCTQGAIQSHH